jgi:hypothetical protein
MPTPKRGPGTRSDLFAKAGAGVARICGAELWRIRYSLLTKLMI